MIEIKISGDGSVMSTKVELAQEGVHMLLPCVRFELHREGNDVHADIVLRVSTRAIAPRFPVLDVSAYNGPAVLDVGTTQHDWKGPPSIEEVERVRTDLRGTQNAFECVDPGPCKKKGLCNGCVFAHVSKDKPCAEHRYDGCRY